MALITFNIWKINMVGTIQANRIYLTLLQAWVSSFNNLSGKSLLLSYHSCLYALENNKNNSYGDNSSDAP